MLLQFSSIFVIVRWNYKNNQIQLLNFCIKSFRFTRRDFNKEKREKEVRDRRGSEKQGEAYTCALLIFQKLYQVSFSPIISHLYKKLDSPSSPEFLFTLYAFTYTFCIVRWVVWLKCCIHMFSNSFYVGILLVMTPWALYMK